MRLCARTLAVDGQVREYARVKVCVPVRWCMSASVRSHVWTMVYVCASARACLDNLWCVFVCVCIFVRLRARLYAFCQGQTHSTHIFCVHRPISQFDVISSSPDLN